MSQKAILYLSDGRYFIGKSVGATGNAKGEICFNTGMTGYQEVFTDPSYYGQVMVTTNAHIGNYGVLKKEEESQGIQIAGLVVKNFSEKFSRKLGDTDLQTYCEDNNLIAIHDVDTRAIVSHIRENGAMNCIISSEVFDLDELQKMVDEVPDMGGLELSSRVSCQEPYYVGDSTSNLRIAVYDFGTKRNILRNFADRGAYLKVFPAKTPINELLDFDPNGIFLSNGPGDPATMDYAIDNIKVAMDRKIPLFGICLGHQLISLASGIGTYKMHHGHRGINHPVINLSTTKCEVTSQNHGFGVCEEDVEKCKDIVEITHRNLNDNTIEGLRRKDVPAFSVQYHPEAAPGPHDSRYLFDDFITLIKENL